MPGNRYDRLIEQSRSHHRTSKTFSGKGAWRHADALRALVRAHRCASMIDWGCGKGWQYAPHPELGVGLDQHIGIAAERVYLYDPAIDGIVYSTRIPIRRERPTEPAELVVCTGVLEHLAEEDVPEEIAAILRLARRVAYITVGTKPAKKTLPDGSNAHATIRPEEWWAETVKQALDRAFPSWGDAAVTVPFIHLGTED